MRPGLLSVIALAACSGTAPRPAVQDDPAPRAEFRDPAEADIPRRDAPVPEPATDETLVFLREGSVWMMPAAGGEPAQLTVRSHEAPNEHPALSPRGDAVAWSAPDDDGVYVIHVMSLEQMIPQRITDGGDGGGDTEPAWSPDGSRIAFVRGHPQDQRNLYVIPAAGGEPTLLLEGDDDEPDHAGSPAWSPDGGTIALSADRREGNGTTLWLLDVESRAIRRLTAPRAGAWYLRDQDPAFSPDGETIAFASNRHVNSADDAHDLDIYTVKRDGSGLTRLTSDPGVAIQPAYSPDGRRLYFASSRSRQNAYEMELYVMAAGGGKQRRLTRDERPQNSAPSPGIIE